MTKTKIASSDCLRRVVFKKLISALDGHHFTAAEYAEIARALENSFVRSRQKNYRKGMEVKNNVTGFKAFI